MTDDRTPPQDLAAEQSVLGAMLLSAEARAEALDMLTGPDFYKPAHEVIFRAVGELHQRGEPCDVVTLTAALMASGDITRVGGPLYVHSLTETVPTTTNVGHYADIVRDRAMLRAVVETGTRIVQRGYNPGGDTGDVVAEWATQEISGVRDRGMADDPNQTPTLDDLLASEITYDWLIPGLLERGDRLVLTGSEGAGKSTLIRQIAVSAAAGLHPFTQATVEPMCVLVVDLENGRHMSQRRYAPIAAAARHAGSPIERERFFIEIRPGGIDVTRPTDARWLLRRVESLRPDLLVIGPAYRMAGGDPNDERTAREVTQTLDWAREAAGCTLIVETHSPHANSMQRFRPIRPVGSSLWLRWPEFGYGLRLVDQDDAQARRLVEFAAWRGPRDERHWPERLEMGRAGWPWTEARPDGWRGAA